MSRKRYTAEQIIGLRRQADVELGNGRKVPEVCKSNGVHEVTYSRWRREYGGLKVDQAKLAFVSRCLRLLEPCDTPSLFRSARTTFTYCAR